MDYNTERDKLKLPEYGRYVHDYVQYIKTIPTRDERTKAAYALVSVMGYLNPALRDTSDFKRKLWDHLMIIADFDMDVDSPFPMPDKELLSEKPQQVRYDFNDIRKRHYGKLVERMARRIPEFEGEEREVLISLVANTMKKNYLNWNKNAVEDITIIQDLKRLIPEEVEISETMQLSDTRDLINRTKIVQKINPKQQQNKHKNRKPMIKKTK
jgi:hypothetical protein